MKYILILVVLLFSCQREKHIMPIKLIYLAGQDICYDSLDQPHLSIRRYLEFNSQNRHLLIAKGNRYYDSVAPIFGLNRFYQIQISDFTTQIVEECISKYISDSSFVTNKHDPWYFYIITEKENGIINFLSFGRYDSIPNDIYILQKHFDSIINSGYLIECEKFKIDSTVFQLEKNLFKKFPPPPKSYNPIKVKFDGPK